MSELSSYKFALSPEGNGIDCHRTWECLYLGVIPIVKKSVALSFFLIYQFYLLIIMIILLKNFC